MSSGLSLPGPLIPVSPSPCCQSQGQGGSEQCQGLSPTSPHSADLQLLPGELSPQHVHTAQLERDELFQPARSTQLRPCSPPSPSSGFTCPREVPGVYHHIRDKDKNKKGSSWDATGPRQQMCLAGAGGRIPCRSPCQSWGGAGGSAAREEKPPQSSISPTCPCPIKKR